MTVLFVEHDMDMVRDISDWVVVMAQGRIIAEGPPDAVMAEPGRHRRLPRRPPRRAAGLEDESARIAQDEAAEGRRLDAEPSPTEDQP